MSITHATPAGTPIHATDYDDEHVLTGFESRPFIGAKVYNSTTQAITTGGSGGAVTFDSEIFDTDGFHSTSSNTSRMTIPAGLGGKYLCLFGTGFEDPESAGELFFKVNGSSTYGAAGGGMATTARRDLQVSEVFDLAAGDYVEGWAFHAAGSDRNVGTGVTSTFSVVKLDSGTVGSGIGAVAVEAAAQAISNGGGTLTAPTINDAEEFDTDGFHDTGSNTNRMTIPTGLGGKYAVQLYGYFAANATGWREARLRKNGTTTVGFQRIHIEDGGNVTPVNASAMLDLAAGDYIEALVAQTSTGSLNISDIRFSIMRLDSGSNSRTTMPGYELDYVEFTSDVSVTATAEGSADTVVTASAVTFDGLTPVIIEFFCPYIRPANTTSDRIILYLFDGSSAIGILGQWSNSAAGNFWSPGTGRRRLTPSAASHTYSIRATVTNAARAGTIGANTGGSGANLPGFIRITRV